MLSRQNNLEQSQIALEETLCAARRQQAKAYELRAARASPSRAVRRAGVPKPTHCWRRFCDWFTDGFDTANLKEAAALLAELAWVMALLK